MRVEFRDEQDEPHPAARDLVRLAEGVMKAEGLPERTEMALMLVDSDRIAELNQTHLGRTGATDVLSFPIEALTPGAIPPELPDGPPPVLGDVLICPEVVAANARGACVPVADEMALMVVHGILHLLGYDHVDDDDAEVMERRERELLAAAGRVRP